MTKQAGFTPIILIILLAVFTVTVVGGVVVLQRRASLQPPVFPTPTVAVQVSLVPSQPPTTTVSCQTDADCQIVACAAGCPIEGPCPPCPRNRCINGNCQKVYPDYSESLDKKIVLYPGQTFSILETNLSLTLLEITPSQKDCLTCPVDIEIEIRRGGKIDKLTFQLPGFATKEWGAHRIKEIFGFRVLLDNVQPELIILRVQKL